jgi:hypothetical protein
MRDAPFIQNPCFKPLADQAPQHPIAHPPVQDFPQLGVVQIVEIFPDIHV